MSYADVLPSAPKYEFKGIQDCLQIVEWGEQDEYEGYMDSSNPYIIFTIDERSFLDCFENSEERSLRKSWEFYDPSINQLLVKIMESKPHAVATTAFTEIFLAWRGPFDQNYPLLGTRLARKWPTIAVEVAWSEPPGKLNKDVKFWLTQSSGKVNVVLSIRVHARGLISMRQWKMRGRTAITVQKLEIHRNPPPNCEKIQGSMRIPFEDIHLRPKAPNDTDFIISHGDMQNLASQVWIAQFDQSM
ncbi:hypothetical protein N7491_005821 [Penicillium cf. griseofulvum]|uniref:Uncharacterized protein n=1 Tax=Penicillium cf. griseofulvum TaxID=2972120 RepID=A0A9W9M4L3_9EURO|nr:hypothetical protein N7472_008505 [Penicillium cf. griseofulvum]KAJ5435226.1 hypothetical protein N7491_005821 [Penicillium cf. griseofulvum]KAJ5453059.1 hypothetical protein N7445_001242 [Penicillium cf. griseofulvum]